MSKEKKSKLFLLCIMMILSLSFFAESFVASYVVINPTNICGAKDDNNMH